MPWGGSTHEQFPRRIGPYKVVGLLGSGGMGVVYAARAQDGTRVAIKSIRPEYAGDPDFRARFSREVELMLRVQGPCLDDAPTWRTTAEENLSTLLKATITRQMDGTSVQPDNITVQYDKHHQAVLVQLVPQSTFIDGAADQGIDLFQASATRTTCNALHDRLTSDPYAWPYGRYVIGLAQVDNTGLTQTVLAYGEATGCSTL